MKKLFCIVALALIGAINIQAFDFDGSVIKQGYRGFVDLGYTQGIGEQGKGHDRFGLLTSHGCQIAPQFFVGVGIGVQYYFAGYDKAVGLPVFAHLRSDFLKSGLTPFAEMRVGYSFIDAKGFYCNPAIGVRLNVADNIGVNFSIGYSLQRSGENDYYRSAKENVGGLDFRVGIDF